MRVGSSLLERRSLGPAEEQEYCQVAFCSAAEQMTLQPPERMRIGRYSDTERAELRDVFGNGFVIGQFSNLHVLNQQTIHLKMIGGMASLLHDHNLAVPTVAAIRWQNRSPTYDPPIPFWFGGGLAWSTWLTEHCQSEASPSRFLDGTWCGYVLDPVLSQTQAIMEDISFRAVSRMRCTHSPGCVEFQYRADNCHDAHGQYSINLFVDSVCTWVKLVKTYHLQPPFRATGQDYAGALTPFGVVGMRSEYVGGWVQHRPRVIWIFKKEWLGSRALQTA